METANKYITVSYKLYTTEDEERDLIEETKEDNPFLFITGLGNTLEAFEDQIKDLNKGDKFDFTIPYAEAYGEYNDEHVIDLPKNMFEVDGRFDAEAVSEGRMIPLLNADGQHLSGVVVEVKADTVVVDMNHPLAGEDLTFVGEVVENRAATDKEVQDMIDAINSGGCGGCEGCGDGCNEGCEQCH
jgi:FKBP-type peptidyl-prolyl cis-trans isomerase SlyD